MTISKNILIAFYSGAGVLLVLSIVFTLRIKAFQKSRKNLVDHLKKVLQKNYQKFWEQEELEKWFKNNEEFAKRRTNKREYIVYMVIFLISLHVFLIVKISADLFSQNYSNFLPANLIILPFIVLSLFFISVLAFLYAGKHSDREGYIQDKFKYCIYFMFPKIKRSLSIFTHVPIPEIYGDPRMLESLWYLKNKKNIRTKFYYYIPPNTLEELKKRINEEILARYKERGLSEIFHKTNKKADHQHFIVGDNSIVRIEKYHLPWPELPREEYSFPNDLYLLNPILAIELKSFLKNI